MSPIGWSPAKGAVGFHLQNECNVPEAACWALWEELQVNTKAAIELGVSIHSNGGAKSVSGLIFSEKQSENETE